MKETLQFIDADIVDISRLELVLARHELSEKWSNFLRRFNLNLKKSP